MVKHFIFLGIPGSGKGTLAAQLELNKKIVHISTGSIFRNEIINKSPMGLKIKSIIESGKYVPDAITNQIIKKIILKLEKEKKSYILDGYPRTLNQVMFLNNNNILIDQVILLKVPEEIVIERLIKRQRKDDVIPIIKKRLVVYKEKTKKLISLYKKENKLIEIDATGTIENTYQNLLKGITFD